MGSRLSAVGWEQDGEGDRPSREILRPRNIRVEIGGTVHGGSEGGERSWSLWGQRRDDGMSCENFAGGRGCGNVDLEGGVRWC